jgi:hypothetical protein
MAQAGRPVQLDGYGALGFDGQRQTEKLWKEACKQAIQLNDRNGSKPRRSTKRRKNEDTSIHVAIMH